MLSSFLDCQLIHIVDIGSMTYGVATLAITLALFSKYVA